MITRRMAMFLIAGIACADVRILVQQLEAATHSGASIRAAGIDQNQAMLTLARAVLEQCESNK